MEMNQLVFHFLHGVKAMRFKFVPLVIILPFILLIALKSFARHATAKHHLTIVYTNDVQGEIEPCG